MAKYDTKLSKPGFLFGFLMKVITRKKKT